MTKARTHWPSPKRGKERVKWLNVHTPRSIPGTSLRAAACALGEPGWSWPPPRPRWTPPALSPAQRAPKGSQWSGRWCTFSLGHHSFQLRDESWSSTFFLPKSSSAPSAPYHSPAPQTFLSSPAKHYPQGLDFQNQRTISVAWPEKTANPARGGFTQGLLSDGWESRSFYWGARLWRTDSGSEALPVSEAQSRVLPCLCSAPPGAFRTSLAPFFLAEEPSLIS